MEEVLGPAVPVKYEKLKNILKNLQMFRKQKIKKT